MTNSLLDDRLLLGVQTPQILHLPVDVHSLAVADECIELAEAYGPPLDENQKVVLRAWMGTRADGTWAASLAAHAVSRQNGKGDELQARELYGLTVLNEPIIHTSHELPTSVDAFMRLVGTLENYDDLRRLVARVRYTNGEQGIDFLSGASIKYRARTGGGGRGLTEIATVVYDEAQHVKPEHLAASSPTMAVHPNPQAILTGSPGLSFSSVWWSIRRDALRRVGGRFAYVENTAEIIHIDDDGRVVSVKPIADQVHEWANANPAFNRTTGGITADFLASQLRLLGPELFAREHLGCWDAEMFAEAMAAVVAPEKWAAKEVQDPNSRHSGKVALCVEVAPNSASASVAFAGGRSDGRAHVEVLESAPGTDWVIERVRRALKGGDVRVVAVEPSGPVSSILPELRKLVDEFDGVDLAMVTGREYAGACEALVVGIADKSVVHLGQAWLSTSVGGARRRKLGNQWVWDRDAPSDASAVISVTVAMRAWQEMPADSPEPFFFVT